MSPVILFYRKNILSYQVKSSSDWYVYLPRFVGMSSKFVSQCEHTNAKDEGADNLIDDILYHLKFILITTKPGHSKLITLKF